jgi:hypothetical protein
MTLPADVVCCLYKNKFKKRSLIDFTKFTIPLVNVFAAFGSIIFILRRDGIISMMSTVVNNFLKNGSRHIGQGDR